MSTTNQFEQFFKQVTEALPQSALTLQQDLQKNLRAAMESSFQRLNLVTREEFEVQKVVLQRTRARLEALETKVAALEAAQTDNSGNSTDTPDTSVV